MISPIFKFTGDESAGKELMGIGHRRLNKLLHDMSFQKLDVHKDNPLVMPNGVTIGCESNYGINEVRIHVPHGGGGDEGSSVTQVMDNRFFVRVGKTSDVTLDLLGHVVSDRTRYYWIDFAANPTASTISDQIAFYKPNGSKKKVKTIGSKAYYLKPRNVSKATFLNVVNFPDYMFHNYIRSFDFMRDPSDQQSKRDRFVAGYHFLASGNSIICTPNIPAPTGGDLEIDTGTSKNPPNRFFVDINTATMCWYHVLQEWKLTEPITHTMATGSISGEIIGANISSGKWVLTGASIFSFTGDIASSFSVVTTESDSLLEPVGAASDITKLTRTELWIDTSSFSTPVRIECSISEGVNAEICFGKADIETITCVNTGYNWYNSASYRRASGIREDVIETGWYNNYAVNDCTPGGACSEDFEVWNEGASYTENRPPWEELSIGLSLFGINAAGYTDVVYGEGRGTYTEAVSCIIHHCDPVLGGGCVNASNSVSGSKTLIGSITGKYGNKIDAYIPCQNITILRSTDKNIENTIITRSVTGPHNAAVDESDMATAFAEWNRTQPLTLPAPSVFQYADTEYIKKYMVEDPANWLPLQYYPEDIPDLEFDITTSRNYWRKTATVNSTGTTNNDLCVIKDCPDTFTASELVSAVILDDRWSFGSQGQVIAVKSNMYGETAIYHDGVNKTQDIVTALIRDKIIRAGESLIDIGLI